MTHGPRHETLVPASFETEARASLGRLDRRGFLRAAVAAGAVLGAPLGCGDPPEALGPAPDLALSHLSPRAYASFNAAAGRIAGPPAEHAIAAGAIDPALATDRWLAREPGLAAPLGQALWLLEWGVPPLVAKWRPFTGLDGAGRDAVLRDLMTSRLDLKRDVFRGIRSLVWVGVYSAPASRAWTGHPGPFGSVGVPIAAAMTYDVEA